MALAVPLSRFTSRVGGGSAFFVRQQASRRFFSGSLRGDGFGDSIWLPVWMVQVSDADLKFHAIGLARLTPFGRAGSCEKKPEPLISDENLSYDEFAA